MAEPGIPRDLIVWAENESDTEAIKLAHRLGVPLVKAEVRPSSEGVRWVLFVEEEVLFLHDAANLDFKPIYVDYLEGDFYRRWRSATRNDILIKAIGAKKGVKTICDATCGLGYDAFFMATFKGLEVTVCERHPVVAELVMSALLRVKEMGRFEEFPLYFHFGNSIEFLQKHRKGFDAVFLDPMYPRGEDRTAKQKKEMQVFRELVGEDLDAELLFEAAWEAASKRVVVKRSDDAATITQRREPDYSLSGKTVRFDIYLKA